jgi:hypothetical protein
MTKSIKVVLERVLNKGFNDRCQQEKYADIDNQFVFALSVDQALKELEALIRTEKLKLLEEVMHQSTVNLKSAKAVAGWAEIRKKQLEAEL